MRPRAAARAPAVKPRNLEDPLAIAVYENRWAVQAHQEVIESRSRLFRRNIFRRLTCPTTVVKSLNHRVQTCLNGLTD